MRQNLEASRTHLDRLESLQDSQQAVYFIVARIMARNAAMVAESMVWS